MGLISFATDGRQAKKMKVLFTFALLALVFSIVSGDGHHSPTTCPEGQGLARKTGNGGSVCVDCVNDDQRQAASCSGKKQTLCELWSGLGYCNDSSRFAYIVQPLCPFMCGICTK